MPRAKSEKRSEPRGSSQCTICNVIISNKTDMPRHMKIHSENRDKLMHRCPYPGCKFENLQKSNVETHIRTHTKAKTERWPDCDFSTVDPGSLTRHRKRIHGYIPKTRRSRQPAPPKPPQILPIAGPSSTLTSSNRPVHIDSLPPQASFQHHEPSSSSSHSQSDRQRQELYHEHQLPKYNPQPPHQVQLPPIRFIPQPRGSLAPCYSRRESLALSRSPSVESESSSSSSSISFSASPTSGARSPSNPSNILKMLPPPAPVHPELPLRSCKLGPIDNWS